MRAPNFGYFTEWWEKGLSVSISSHIEMAITAIERAAFDPPHWDDALVAVTAATGSRVGQLCAIGGGDLMSFNRLTGLSPEFMAEWAAQDFDHPAINSRVRIGMQAPVLHSLDERAFQTEQDGRDCREYGELIDQSDIPYICLTNLVRTSDTHIGFAVLRGKDQGNIEGEQRRVFDHLARHAQRAVNTSRAIGIREAAAIARGMDACHAISFVCDIDGRVMDMSHRAQEYLASDQQLALNGRRLVERRDGRDLSKLARTVALDRAAPMPPLTIRGDGDLLPLIVEFAPIPAETPGFPGAPGAIVTLRRPWSHVGLRIESRAIPLYQLTAREAEVAISLCLGKSPQQVADELSLGIGTVRTHVRRLFDKTGTNSLAQLVAMLSAYDD